MALVSNPQNSSNLFSSFTNQYNINKQDSEDLHDIIKSLNIIDPEALSKEDISVVLKRIDDYNGFFSTQQLKNIDYKKFSEHVFFDSAVSKVSYAFDRISNMPYDLDEFENIKYKNKTDGFTNYVLESLFPKSLGYISFSGNEKLVIYDEQGKLLNESSTKKIGILNPESQKFSFDFWLKANSSGFVDNQVVFNKFSNEQDNQNGFICYLTTGTSVEVCFLNFLMFIDGNLYKNKCLVSKDTWQNIVISVNDSSGLKKATFMINGNIIDDGKTIESSSKLKNSSFGEKFKEKDIPLVIGGIFFITDDVVTQDLNLLIEGNQVNFVSLKGSIDEFRFFHKVRSKKTVKKEMGKNIYSQKALKLYLRMNEPAGDYNNSCLAIDYSGNKLHGIIYNVANNDIKILSNTNNVKINQNSPIKNEKLMDSPVLNAGFTDIILLRKNIIEQAKKYDNENPNLVFNLMPKHYFLNSADFDNLPVYTNEKEYALPDSVIKDDGVSIDNKTSLAPKLPANNELVNIVLIWARFFDQLKAYIASITNLLNVDYDSLNNKKIIGMQIPILCKMYGIQFKELLPHATKEKLNNNNLTYDDILSEFSIRKIQNILWQRFLLNTQDFLKTKGTIRSIESTFGSFGIDFSKFINIKEYSSFNDISKDNNFKIVEVKKDTIDFGNKQEINIVPTYSNTLVDDFSNNKTFLKISSIKTHLTKKDNVTETLQDGLSIDWSIEYFFKFNEVIKDLDLSVVQKGYAKKQCMFRIDTDGSPTLIVYYKKYGNEEIDLGKITINIQPIKNNSSYNLELEILDVDLFNMPKYLCLNQKVDLVSNKITYEAYVDDIGKQIKTKKAKSVSYTTPEIAIKDAQNNITKSLTDIAENDLNLSFYKNNIDFSVGNFNYTNNNYLSPLISTNDDTTFQGQIANIRAWNKRLSSTEISSHVKNIENTGTDDNNLLNNVIFNFFVDNKTLTLDNGISYVNLKDMSNNLKKVNGEFEYLNECKIMTRSTTANNIFKYESFLCKVQNPKIDEPSSYNKVNIISYKSDENKIATGNNNSFPANNMPIDFKYDDVSRVSIDMSIVKIINSDISKIISDINQFTSKLSNSQSMFEYHYDKIEKLREDYFNKYSESEFINYASIGNVFKYFDNIMSTLLYDIVPSNVRFEGFNFVYESHMLERHKYEHKNKDSGQSIMNTEAVYNFSREIPVTRRSLNYNTNRTLSKE